MLEKITKLAGRAGLVIAKNSPNILIGVGITGMVGAGVLACTKVLAAKDVLKEKDEAIEDFENSTDIEVFTKSEYNKELAKIYFTYGAKVAKLYGPAITLGVVSIGCILGGTSILNKRNLALMAAYKGVEESYSRYKKKMEEKFGKEKVEEAIREKETVVDEAGNETEVNRYQDYSVYSRCFDEYNINYTKDASYNKMFLTGIQNYANDLLHARGHVFLNEVYDELGMERSQAGQIVGWVLNGDGDNYVDFGIFNGENAGAIRFLVEDESSVWLDFNVDGVVYDLI